MRQYSFLGQSTALLLVFGLFSCQPSDVNMSGSKNTVTDVKSLSIENQNKMIAVGLERQIEALQLIKASLDSQYAQELQLVMTETDGQTYLKSKNSKLTWKNNVITNDASISFQITDKRLNADGSLKSLILKKTQGEDLKSQGIIFTDNRKTDFVEFTTTHIIQATPDTDGFYVIETMRSSDTSSRFEKQTTHLLDSRLKVKWNGQISTLNSALEIQDLKMYLTKKGAANGRLSLVSQSSALNISLNSCTSINGNLQYDVDNKIAKVEARTLQNLNVQDSTFTFEDGMISVAQGCESRPWVDLTRFIK